jgi:hypothetical protein
MPRNAFPLALAGLLALSACALPGGEPGREAAPRLVTPDRVGIVPAAPPPVAVATPAAPPAQPREPVTARRLPPKPPRQPAFPRVRPAALAAMSAGDALAVFELLGEAEASVHGTDLEATAFHEVGADDAIADIVGAMLLLDDLDPDRIVTTPLAAGGGEVEMSHGRYPVPAPAVVEIAERADWSLRGGPIETERLHHHRFEDTVDFWEAYAFHERTDQNEREMEHLTHGPHDTPKETLDRLGRPRVSLREELAFVEDYLEIETMRHGGRVLVDVEVAPAALDASVPTMILQPLVENAMRHGVADRAVGGQVRVRAARDDGRLELEVSDDGPGFREPDPIDGGGGVGLRNTEERLRKHFGDATRFEVGNAPGGGARVRIEIPVADSSHGAGDEDG